MRRWAFLLFEAENQAQAVLDVSEGVAVRLAETTEQTGTGD